MVEDDERDDDKKWRVGIRESLRADSAVGVATAGS